MPFWEGTQAEEDALRQVATLHQNGDLLTNQTLQTELLTQGAQFTAPPNTPEIQIDGSGNLNIVRSSKINYFKVSPLGGAPLGVVTGIVESNQWHDGDVAYFFSKEMRLVTVTLPNVSIKLWNAGDFLKMVRFFDTWQPEAKYPEGLTPFATTEAPIDTWTALASDTEITVTHQILKVLAVAAPTPASAVYEVTAVTGAGNVINLYADGILIAEGEDGSSIDNMGTDLETYINAGSMFTAVYNAGTNQLTISDARNLGAAGNSFLLSSQELNGAAGTIVSQFASGANGAASNVTIDTIQGLVVGNSYQIHNGMGANTVTLDTGGNLLGSALPLALAVGDWCWVSCVDAAIGRVK